MKWMELPPCWWFPDLTPCAAFLPCRNRAHFSCLTPQCELLATVFGAEVLLWVTGLVVYGEGGDQTR